MNIEETRDYCLSQKEAEECMPFGDDFLVMKIMGKMFAAINLEKKLLVLKCEPAYAIELRERYEGIEPAWHFNKTYWNQIWLDSDVDDLLTKKLIVHSKEEVIKKMPKKVREEYAKL